MSGLRKPPCRGRFGLVLLSATICLAAAPAAQHRHFQHNPGWLKQATQDAAAIVPAGTLRLTRTRLPDRQACLPALVARSNRQLGHQAAVTLHDAKRALLRERVRERIREDIKRAPRTGSPAIRLIKAVPATPAGEVTRSSEARSTADPALDPAADDTRMRISVTAPEHSAAGRATRTQAEGQLSTPRATVSQPAADRAGAGGDNQSSPSPPGSTSTRPGTGTSDTRPDTGDTNTGSDPSGTTPRRRALHATSHR